MSDASMRTFANEQAYREKRTRETYTNPGFSGVLPDPSWDAMWGSLEANRDEAHAAGRGYRAVGMGGSMGPMASLRRAAAEPAFDATEYQRDRAALDRDLNDNFARKWSQRGALNDADRARDPNLVDYDATRALQRKAAGVAADDQIEADSFARMEPIRRGQRYERVGEARDMADYHPGVVQSRLANERAFDTNDTRENVANTNKDARTGAAAINSLARAAGTQTFGDANAETRIQSAIGAIQPNVPGQATGLKPLPPEWSFDQLLLHFKGNEKAAEEWLRMNGYRR